MAIGARRCHHLIERVQIPDVLAARRAIYRSRPASRVLRTRPLPEPLDPRNHPG